MKILVAGSRNYENFDRIKQILSYMKDKYGVYTVIEGGQRGADLHAKQAAIELGLPVIQIDAQWETYGRAAGPIRNKLMLDEKPDLVIIFHEDIHKSKGSKNMLLQARGAGVPVLLFS